MGIGRLLVANRGEIAVRVFRACREMGIETVAVYSEADADALHVREADTALPIGGASASDSYLNIPNIVAAIRESGADAVHPGYGFLSESAAFARAVMESGAIWVGPPPEAMEKVGLKVRAKEIAAGADVPTIPGYDGEEQSEERLGREAERIGYPVLVKASAGGGGRGMREVRDPKELPEAVRSARREAESAFSDGTVFLEKLVENPRHIEVQVIGDQHGDVIHLYERECSIQRRHQKVVEEAPSAALSPEERAELCGAAVRLAREVGYTNAGTVEFLVSGDGDFYFLEMNARLQVEHPVTEEVTGRDLVMLQLAVAAGERLPVSQEEICLSGAAIEVRIYAEDERGLPAGGRLLAFDPPRGNGMRNEVGVETGDVIPLNYDSMVSKLIVHAPDRERAVERLSEALDAYTVIGAPTNIPMLRSIASSTAFERGDTRTDFLKREGLDRDAAAPRVPGQALAVAAVADAVALRKTNEPFAAGGWRQLGAATRLYSTDDGIRPVNVERRGNLHIADIGDGSLCVEVLSATDGEVPVVYAVLDGIPVHAAVHAGRVEVRYGGMVHDVRRIGPPEVEGHSGTAGSDGGLVAPMPGTVIRVLVGEGDEVSEGQLLVVLEAMKMEQPIVSPHDGVVESVPHSEGDMVSGGAVLVEIAAAESRT